jgi:hypothetical protein
MALSLFFRSNAILAMQPPSMPLRIFAEMERKSKSGAVMFAFMRTRPVGLLQRHRAGTIMLWEVGVFGMYDVLAKARYYREQAENMRALAARNTKSETHAALLSLAENYDREHAKLLEQARHPQSRKPHSPP